ncbi:CBS domain-containing protein [Halanaeroarchaeum sulfurireducens]|uniref:Signal transduction protein n=2 Tax=Halanaeroarchaeum sulfurireducens TaxID=1604004 RepID=A0A0F7PFL3_9EURY|nr:CBS domain-containing protein [Halanaeroarchaeum sulfurireducens]AKH98108.1 signal transduction protein with CBS domains [Halanaeroarchaeum sulfurireducens]ALG82502.1 signal transduction protein [Halanaeroarchaeum sulfurireducens]
MAQLTLRDVMTREFVGVSPSDTVVGAVRLIREEGGYNAVVLQGREPKGVLTAGDVLDALAAGEDVETRTVGDVMQTDAPSLSPDVDIGEAATTMLSTDSDVVLVNGDDGLLGIVTARELARYTWGRTNRSDQRPDELNEELGEQTATATEEYSTQSICEVCGSLSHDLVNVNGQLLCPDCREV